MSNFDRMKKRRQKLRELLSQGFPRFYSYQDIQAGLEEEGFVTSEESVKRDCKALGAFKAKSPSEGGRTYWMLGRKDLHDTIEKETAVAQARARLVFGATHVIDASNCAPLLIPTVARSGEGIAEALEASRMGGVLGVFGSPDMVVVYVERDMIEEVRAAIEKLLFSH